MKKQEKYQEDLRQESRRGRKRAKLSGLGSREWEGTNEEILIFEAKELLRRKGRSDDQESTIRKVTGSESARKLRPISQFAPGSEVELEVCERSSTGDGLALSKDGSHVYVIPYSVPGDVVKVTLNRLAGGPVSVTDFIGVVKPSEKRDDSLIRCQYFAKCAGCQLQMLPYQAQLDHKKTIVEKAYRNFSGLSESQIPRVESTAESPLQYGYRTKITPWFITLEDKSKTPPIGFGPKFRKFPIDIENCPIATDILQEGLKSERARVARDFNTYKRGATLLLRESTERKYHVVRDNDREPKTIAPAFETLSPTSPPSAQPSEELSQTPSGAPMLTLKHPTHTDLKTCQTNMASYSTEYVDHYSFTNIAGAFFQNNNSVLSPFTAYIRTHIQPPLLDPTTKNSLKYLLDAYCGSGLFSITLSSHFTSTLGIDIDASSVDAARVNATANKAANAGFIEADASALFVDVPFPPAQTLCVIDPPRKGCSRDFLRQLMRFGPRRVVYVSCNVHTQARDVGWLVNGWGAKVGDGRDMGEEDREGEWRYEVESLKGFDFFPQTGHVESVAILNRVERE